MWTDHTALMAFGTTMWGINRLAYGFGLWGYNNPYYSEPYSVGDGATIDYSHPLEAPIEPTESTAQPSDTPSPGMSDFDVARQAFYQGDFAAALTSTNKALAALPNDPIIHEFRALVLFAQGNYKDAAAGLYSVLAVGPGWDWTTLISLYPSVDVYTSQLRALEATVRAHQERTDARFVLSYLYLTMGNKDAATAQLKELYRTMPQDKVIKELLLMNAGPEAIGVAATTPEAPKPAPGVDVADLGGKWGATGEGNTKFALGLTKEGTFSWTFTQSGKPQTVQGVYALDGNVLAMEPETGGTMLAEITSPTDGKFEFHLLGAPPGDPGLKFVKSQ